MPKTYITFAEKEKAKALRDRDKQIRALSGELSMLKYKTGYAPIQEITKYSLPTIAKVINTPLNATLEQLFEVCIAAGKRVVINIEE